MPLPTPLSPQIHLYFCPLLPSAIDDNVAKTIRSWLPQDELDKVDRYIQQSAQVQGLMVRGYLRAILSQHSKLTPDEWQFAYGAKGKPALTPAQFALTGIDFNLSHSGDWLLLAVYRQPLQPRMLPIELGVDIERCRSNTNIHSILNHYFSEPETTALLALPKDLQRDRFFDLWALKESYIKAKGLGLALSLKSFGFDLSAILKTELTLASSQAVPATLLQSGLTEQMLLKQRVDLHLYTEPSAKGDNVEANKADTWQCILGHLDDDYRFALSVNGQAIADASIEYQAQACNIHNLVLEV